MATKSNQKPEVRVVDFGEAFTPPDKPETLRTPLALRAPEVLFEDKWDHRADLWSAACLVFEMLDGQPPFDTIMITKDLLIAQMAEEIGALPDRWKDRWDSSEMDGESDESLTLEQWLAELYFDDDKEAQMSKAEVQDWAAMLRKLLIFEPAERASAADILRDGDLD